VPVNETERVGQTTHAERTFGKAVGAIIRSGKTGAVSSQEWQQSAFEFPEQSDLLNPSLGSLLADSLDRESQEASFS
jgi:hypothetical protein